MDRKYRDHILLVVKILTPQSAKPIIPDIEDDPVIAEYNVYITPELQEQVYLLQFPNRDRQQPYNSRTGAQPVEMRMKPRTNFMELDIATNVASNFDKSKGMLWGSAMKTANESGAAGFGMASGFGKGNRGNELFNPEKRGKKARDPGQAPVGKTRSERFDVATEAGRVLNKQTLGGQIVLPAEGKPMYMLGTFRQSMFYYILIIFREKSIANGHSRGASSNSSDRSLSNAATVPPHRRPRTNSQSSSAT